MLLSIHLLAIKPHGNILYNAYHRGCAVFWDIKNRLLRSITTIKWDGQDNFVSVYTARTILTRSSTCPALSVVYCPSLYEEIAHQGGVWNLQNKVSKERTAQCFLKVDKESQQCSHNRVRQIPPHSLR